MRGARRCLLSLGWEGGVRMRGLRGCSCAQAWGVGGVRRERNAHAQSPPLRAGLGGGLCRELCGDPKGVLGIAALALRRKYLREKNLG